MNVNVPSIDFNSQKICIIGAGGFAKEVLCCLQDILGNHQQLTSEYACFLVADKDYDAYKDKRILGTNVIPQSSFDPNIYKAIVGVGEPGLRRKIVHELPLETEFITLIHPSVVMSSNVEIAEGSVVAAGCVLSCDIKIGKHAQLNPNSTIGHDCNLGDYFTATPACNVSGNCTFGDCVYLGTNTSVRQGITICDEVTIGMGSVVVKNISDPGIYVGNPARKFSKS